MIVLLSAKQGGGKSTAAEAIAKMLTNSGYRVPTYKFAAPLYDMQAAVHNVLSKYGINRPAKDGELLQILGTEYGRNCINTDVWPNCLKNIIEADKKVNTLDFLNTQTVYLIDDLRFKNEAAFFRSEPDSILIRLEASEEARKPRCSYWRENSNHQSEIDLDDYTDWDLVIDTEKNNKEESTQILMEYINGRISGIPKINRT